MDKSTNIQLNSADFAERKRYLIHYTWWLTSDEGFVCSPIVRVTYESLLKILAAYKKRGYTDIHYIEYPNDGAPVGNFISYK